jgi:hypothetical protein
LLLNRVQHTVNGTATLDGHPDQLSSGIRLLAPV